MPNQSTADTQAHQIDTNALEQWLGKAIAQTGELKLNEITIPSSGYSALTMLLNVSVTIDGQTSIRLLVLRIEKSGQHVFLGTDIGLQGQMMAALADHSITVPAVVAVENDPSVLGGKFLVMDQVNGVSLPQSPNYNEVGLLPTLKPEQRLGLWNSAVSTIANMNKLDWQQGFEFLNKPQYGEPGLNQYLGWLKAWRDEAMNNKPNPIIDQAIEQLLVQQPKTAHVDVLWGDSNPGNFMFTEQGEIAAALDFEAAALGPAEIDLAWWFFMDEMLTFGIERLDGLPNRDQQIALYETVLGRKVSDLTYYELLAAVRIALVIARTTNVLIKTGRLPVDNKAAFKNPAIQLLATKIGMSGGEMGEDYMAFAAALNDR